VWLELPLVKTLKESRILHIGAGYKIRDDPATKDIVEIYKPWILPVLADIVLVGLS
jgi:hypothetical protein